jgi:hypothetical protein
MKKILKAKHWQIFMISVGLPVIIQIAVILFSMITNNPVLMDKFLLPIIMVFFVGGFLGWFWSIAINLQDKLPGELKLKVNRFKTFLLLSIVYIVIYFVFIDSSEAFDEPATFAITIPFHMFFMFCILYCLFIVSKTFKTVELQRIVTFSDFAVEFFLIWFFPVGIWIIQPKINKMIEK